MGIWVSEAGGRGSELQIKLARVCLLIHRLAWLSLTQGLERFSCWKAALKNLQLCRQGLTLVATCALYGDAISLHVLFHHLN